MSGKEGKRVTLWLDSVTVERLNLYAKAITGSPNMSAAVRLLVRSEEATSKIGH